MLCKYFTLFFFLIYFRPLSRKGVPWWPVTQNCLFYQVLGNTQEAIGAYADIIKRNLADESSLAVAVNNLVALKGPKDVNDSLKKLDRIKEKDGQNFQLVGVLDLKLSPKQKEAIYANRVLLLLHANKMDQVFKWILCFCVCGLSILSIATMHRSIYSRTIGCLMSYIWC